MANLDDLTKRKFGRLTVAWPCGISGRSGSIHWLCVCICGNLSIVIASNLRTNSIVSCGCHRRERLLKHGQSKDSRTYSTWKAMRKRCNNPHASNYRYYGGRGIQVSPRWDNFDNFLMDMGEKPDGKTIERIDVNGDYMPSNCKWATHTEQMRNRRR